MNALRDMQKCTRCAAWHMNAFRGVQMNALRDMQKCTRDAACANEHVSRRVQMNALRDMHFRGIFPAS